MHHLQGSIQLHSLCVQPELFAGDTYIPLCYQTVLACHPYHLFCLKLHTVHARIGANAFVGFYAPLFLHSSHPPCTQVGRWFASLVQNTPHLLKNACCIHLRAFRLCTGHGCLPYYPAGHTRFQPF